MGALVEFGTPIPDDICDTSKSDTLHLPVAHYEMSREIAICNDDYKFTTYPHSILHEFVIDDEVMVTNHFERFLPGSARTLHARRQDLIDN